MSALNKLRDAISPNRQSRLHDSTRPNGSIESEGERGREGRGRTEAHSTGRGGAGNFKRSESAHVDKEGNPLPSSEDAKVASLAQDRSRSRSRTRGPEHTGRGGVGNFRSPSRDPGAAIAEEQQAKQEAALERDVSEKYAAKEAHVSTGRGGAGNIKDHVKPKE